MFLVMKSAFDSIIFMYTYPYIPIYIFLFKGRKRENKKSLKETNINVEMNLFLAACFVPKVCPVSQLLIVFVIFRLCVRAKFLSVKTFRSKH